MHRAVTVLVPLLATLLSLSPLIAEETGTQKKVAEKKVEAPQITVESIEIEPAKPSIDTLCQRRVKLHNAGEKTASSLLFAVKINGQELPVYSNQLFMYRLDPGTTTEIPLYNFWTTETGRTAPKDGNLEITVELLESRWTTVTDQAGIETWTPTGDVAGLPALATLKVPLSTPPKQPKS